MTNANEFEPKDIIAAYMNVDTLTTAQVSEWKARAEKWNHNPSSVDPAYAVVMLAAAAL